MRDGQICTDCLDRHAVWPALRHGCYRGSRIATIPLAVGVELHRAVGTWRSQVDAFVALSDFQRQRMAQAGLPLHRVHVKPNHYPGWPAVRLWTERDPYVVFAGRLTAEKGLVCLLKAWAIWGAAAPELRIVGDGDLRAELEHMAEGLPVRFMGQLPTAEAKAQIAAACLLVLPSECFEGFPMVLLEAFAFGTPVAVSNLGPLPSIVEHAVTGVVFQAAHPESLLQGVRGAWELGGTLERLGRGARRAFEEKYTEDANYTMLMQVYQRAMTVSRSDKACI